MHVGHLRPVTVREANAWLWAINIIDESLHVPRSGGLPSLVSPFAVCLSSAAMKCMALPLTMLRNHMRQWLLGICLVTLQIMILVEQVGHQEGPNRNKGRIASFMSCNDYIAIYWWQTPAANTVLLGSWSISANRCNTYLKRQADVEISLRKSTPFFHTTVQFYNMSVPWKVFLFAWKLAGKHEYVCSVHLSKMSSFWLKWAHLLIKSENNLFTRSLSWSLWGMSGSKLTWLWRIWRQRQTRRRMQSMQLVAPMAQAGSQPDPGLEEQPMVTEQPIKVETKGEPKIAEVIANIRFTTLLALLNPLNLLLRRRQSVLCWPRLPGGNGQGPARLPYRGVPTGVLSGALGPQNDHQKIWK